MGSEGKQSVRQRWGGRCGNRRSRTGSRIGSLFGAVVSCSVAIGAGQGLAQGTVAQTTAAQQSAKPDTKDASQQGGAQVHTGVSSGLDAEARLQNLLADHQFLRIEAQLDQMAPDEAAFYRGILANRKNDLKTSVHLLEPLAEKIATTGAPGQEKLLRRALAEDYLRLGEWAKAALAYRALETHVGSQLTADEQDELELPVKLLPLAAANPPMTVDPYDPFGLPVNRNLLGLVDIPVFVDARPHSWMLEPTAPFNLISRSLAREAGLTVSDAAVTIHTVTGRPMQVHMTVIPRFTIGGAITFHDMTAFVFEDADYAFKETHYQVEGVLGYPAVSAFGSLSIKDNATIEVRPMTTGSKDEGDFRSDPGARLFFDGDQMIVAMKNAPGAERGATGGGAASGAADGGTPSGGTAGVGAADGGAGAQAAKPGEVSGTGEERMFVLDASGQQTYLTSRYYEEHSGDFAKLKMEMFSLPGAPKMPAQPSYNAETVNLAFGPTVVSVHYIPVLTQPVGDAALDDVYGVLGLDALDQLQSYTFDFKAMTLSVRNRE